MIIDLKSQQENDRKSIIYNLFTFIKCLGEEMKLEIKEFSKLSTDELFEIYKARIAVFVVEQNCPYQEVDETDKIAAHIWLSGENGELLSYLRLFRKDECTLQIGRVLSVKRKCGYAEKVMLAAIDRAKEISHSDPKIKEIYLEAQTYAVRFYERFGFESFGEEFLEDGIPHICMRKIIEN